MSKFLGFAVRTVEGRAWDEMAEKIRKWDFMIQSSLFEIRHLQIMTSHANEYGIDEDR